MAAKPERLRVRFSDEASYLKVRTILAYESSVRGMTTGQAASELVMAAVDVSAYPEEVQARLREIAEESARRAIEKSLKATGEDPSGTPGD